MALKGAVTFVALLCLLILAVSGLSHAAPISARPYVAVAIFFPGAFIAISATLRVMEGRLSSLSDICLSARDGGIAFLYWALTLLILAAITGAAFLLFG